MHPLHLDPPILACHSETPPGSKNLPYISLSLPQLPEHLAPLLKQPPPGALPIADRFRRADWLVLGDLGLEGRGPGQQSGRSAAPGGTRGLAEQELQQQGWLVLFCHRVDPFLPL